jgi:hypothetical protein
MRLLRASKELKAVLLLLCCILIIPLLLRVLRQTTLC